MPGYNKSLSRLSPPVSPPKEIERIITDIYDTLNNLSGDSSTTPSQNITITTASGPSLVPGTPTTLTHPNTSGQSSVDNSNGSVIQDVTLDNFGHVTSLASTDLDSRYLALTGGTLTGALTAGSGILFGSDTAAANTLDDYEEGTWTPVYGSSSATVVSSTYDSGVTFGQYTKIGDTVHLWGRIRTDQLTWSSNSGSVFITGIPFSANNVIGNDVLTYAGSIAYANNWSGEHPMHLGIAGGSNNRIFLYYQEIHFDSNNGGYLNISPTDTNTSTDGNDLVFQITYKV